MVPRDSILRRLPGELNRKQALFLDGIRHAAEFIAFAHKRLQGTLTTIALADHQGAAADELYTSAFVDAWAIVDSVDRFRTLWQLVPRGEVPPGHLPFSEITMPIRNLRNVADHLAQRVEYVVSHKGSALGVLSWLTVVSQQPPEVLSCAIVPGTLQGARTNAINPAGRTIDLPSGVITLAAGEHEACLSDVIPQVELRVRALESTLTQEFQQLGLSGSQAGADLIIKLTISSTELPAGS